MGTYKSRNPGLGLAILILLILHYPGTALSPDGKTAILPGGSTPLSGNNMPIVSSPPFATPVTGKDIQSEQPVNNQGLQYPVGNQQPQEQSINSDQPVVSGFSSVNQQPFLGANNQPFSSVNQPLGFTNQQGSVGHAPFEKGASNNIRLFTEVTTLVSLLVTMHFLI